MSLGVKRATLQHLRPDRPPHSNFLHRYEPRIYIFVHLFIIALTVQTTFHVRSTNNMDEESLLSLQQHATMEIERELELSLNCMCIFLPIFRRREISSLQISRSVSKKKKSTRIFPSLLSLSPSSLLRNKIRYRDRYRSRVVRAFNNLMEMQMGNDPRPS